MYLGVDCGTQGTKALIVDENGTALGRGYASHALTERPTGAREQVPAWWVDALKQSVKQALLTAPRGEVLALGVSGQQHGLVVLDERFQVIRPAKLWNDTETGSSNDEIIRRLGGAGAFFERFGIVPLTGYTISKLMWLAENEPDNFARIRHILLPHEYLNFWLTGELRAEYGDASGTGYFDVRKRMWAREVLDAIDGGTGQLFSALPLLMQSHEIVGRLRAEVASELGLPAGCLVSAGGGDNMMGAIGTGNVCEGVVTISLGTSSTVYSYSDRVSDDATGNVAPFCSSSGGWLPLVCTMNATNVVNKTIELLKTDLGNIEGALESIPPGADGLVYVPFLNGERTPDLPGARGSLCGMTMSNLTPAHFIRATIEGVSFGILNGLDLILAGRPAQVIKVIGGGSRSKAWRQLLADATGAVIQVPTEDEAGCLGAAIQAMVAYSHVAGSPKDFVSVTERLTHVAESETCYPRGKFLEPYTQARLAYAQALSNFYSVR